MNPQEELRHFTEALQPTLTKALRSFCRRAAQGLGAEFDPFAVGNQAWIEGQSFRLVQDLFSSTFDTTRRALRESLAEGWAAGETVDRLAGRIRSEFDSATRHRSYLIARTEVTAAANAATLGVWGQAKVPFKEWLTGRDERVCPVCAPLDGEVQPLDRPFSLGMLAPPAHPNCLPGDTLVTAKGITAASKRWYDGQLVIIETARSKRLACTPNHPILTPGEWVAARFLNVGDYVVSHVGVDRALLRDSDHEHMPTRIEQIAETFGCSEKVTATEVPVAPEDFHGDGWNSKIAVIWADSDLEDRVETTFPQDFGERAFQGGDTKSPFLPGECTLVESSDGICAAASPRVCGHHLGCPLFRRHLSPFDALSLGLSADMDASRQEPATDDTTTNLEEVSNSLFRYPGLVQPDKVIHIQVVPFHGYVFNLQTDAGYYLAEGIVTHNCRCTMRSVEHPSGVPDFASLDEATAWAGRRYQHIRWEFDGAAVETITPTLRQFHLLAQEYPEVALRLRYVGTFKHQPGRFGENTWAHASTDGQRIGLNPKYYGNPTLYAERLRAGVATHPQQPVPWSAPGCGSVESVMTHEFGHMVEFYLRAARDTSILRYAPADGLGELAETVDMWQRKHYSRAEAAKLSRYAEFGGPVETWAEAFASSYHTPGTLQPYVRKQKVLLETLFDRSQWHHKNEWDYLSWAMMDPKVTPLTPDEIRAAREAIVNLRRKLGLE